MLSFEVRKTGGESEIRKVHRDVIHIGASTGNDLVVRARGVLGRHARISVAGEELRLEVLGSAPGSDVTLNGSVVKTAALAAGDRINIGEATITLLNGPAPNPNRISAPPPRGRDAFSLASAALSPAPPAAPPARRPVPRRRRDPRRRSRRPRPAAPADVAAAPSDRARRPLGRLLRGASAGPCRSRSCSRTSSTYVASATPLHSLAFISLQAANEGEAIAAVWKGTLPKLSAKALADARALPGPADLLEGGARLKLFPVPRPAGDPVGILVLPADTLSDPALFDFAVARGRGGGIRPRRAERGRVRRPRGRVPRGAPALRRRARRSARGPRRGLHRDAEPQGVALARRLGPGAAPPRGRRRLGQDARRRDAPRALAAAGPAARARGGDGGEPAGARGGPSRARRARRRPPPAHRPPLRGGRRHAPHRGGRRPSGADAGASLPPSRGARGHGARRPHGAARRPRDRDDLAAAHAGRGGRRTSATTSTSASRRSRSACRRSRTARRTSRRSSTRSRRGTAARRRPGSTSRR